MMIRSFWLAAVKVTKHAAAFAMKYRGRRRRKDNSLYNLVQCGASGYTITSDQDGSLITVDLFASRRAPRLHARALSQWPAQCHPSPLVRPAVGSALGRSLPGRLARK